MIASFFVNVGLYGFIAIYVQVKSRMHRGTAKQRVAKKDTSALISTSFQV